MRNAGDLETASDVYALFQSEAAAALAAGLGLSRSQAAFTLPTAELEDRYFDLLGDIVVEIQGKIATAPP